MSKFYKKETPPVKKRKPKKEKLTGCEACKLHEDCISPKMPVYGRGKKKILIITGMATAKEDQENGHFLGETGRMIKNAFTAAGVNSLKDDCWKINAIRCYKKGEPSAVAIKTCRELLVQTINELKPEKIIVFGKLALQTLIGHKESVTSIDKWLGWKIPDQEYKCWIYPIQTPAYIIEEKYTVIPKKLFIKQVRAAVDHKEEFPNNTITDSHIDIITEPTGATIFLEGIKMFYDTITFDYETSGIKPQKEGHKIYCISIAGVRNKSYCFPIFNDLYFRKALRRVLQDPSIKKISHNVPFEDVWTKEILGYSVKGWHWDTMLAQHIIDNRGSSVGLKFQTYVRYGISGYNDSVEPFIASKDKSANGFNNIGECPQDELLKYCAMDSLFTFRLYKDQKELVESKYKEPFDLFMNGIVALSKASTAGIHVDMNFFEKQNKMLLRRKERLENRINSSEEAQQWDGEEPFNFNSSKMLQRLLFKILKHKSTKLTAKGGDSVDAEALGKLNHIPFVADILEWKKLDKLQNTYLSGFMREENEGKIHPNFNLHTVVTMRSSSNSPNFQNIPKRDKMAQQIIRGGIIPRPGRQLLEVDYSGIEVRISCAYTKDPVMINYIHDPTTDMHRDTARELFMTDEVTKDERYLSKNGFVFPEFYGSYYKQCAENIWNELPVYTKERLAEKGIKTYDKFESHVEKVEADFWDKRFKVYKKWKKETWDRYQQKGFLKSHTGFIYDGVMKRNDALNYCIQGSAFHCLLWSFTQMSKWLEENRMKSLLIGQIHDSMILDIVPEELPLIKPVIRRIMCEDIRQAFPWIIVPLEIESEITDVDGNWSSLKKCEL